MKLLETALNRYIALDPEAPGKLEPFEGKVICLDITGIGQTLFLIPAGGRIEVVDTFAGDADATLRGSPVALFRMGLMQDVTPMLLRGEVEIIGDMRTGRAFKSFLASMRIDWEEHLSRMTGDVVAHEVVKAARSIDSWGRRSLGSLAMDISEYLTEETGDIITDSEIDDFCERVEVLRADLERAEARLERLMQSRPGA